MAPMHTRSQSNRHRNNKVSSEGEPNDEAPGSTRILESKYNADSLSTTSRAGVDKLLKRVKLRGARPRNEKVAWPDKEHGKVSTSKDMDVEYVPKSSLEATDGEVSDHQGVTFDKIDDEADDSIWEDGYAPDPGFNNSDPDDASNGVEVDISWPEESPQKRPTRRFSAEEKEIAENLHKVNLLCLLARGRVIDRACDDSLIQAALLSLVPRALHEISELSHVTKISLAPVVLWFHKHFSIRAPKPVERSFPASLASALDAGEGTPEEIAALSVALFRALNLTTRFVSVLDVSSLKPEAGKPLPESQSDNVIFKSSTLMVDKPTDAVNSPARSFLHLDDKELYKTSLNGADELESSTVAYSCLSKEYSQVDPSKCVLLNDSAGSASMGASSKRKGDLEFEMQLQMALSATATTPTCSGSQSKHSTQETLSSVRKLKKVGIEEPMLSTYGISTAFGSRKVGGPLYWAEVYCTGESSTGRWVHIDAINNIIDGEHKIESMSAACKTSLRYVVAFAGFGAKDVTRRYCQKWYKIASKRVDPVWWDRVLAPLKELELRATEPGVDLKSCTDTLHHRSKVEDVEVYDNLSKKHALSHGNTLGKCSDHGNLVSESTISRDSLEDMELITKALTESLPTNQQAYKNHSLYVIERWLSKFQILHPKGPVLGFVSGHPVYPRSCVQTIRTKEKWLREGRQLKPGQPPAKAFKRSKGTSSRASEDGISDSLDVNESIQLYGVWQTEPLCLPPAVNGMVPKNERGQVDVWSEKCLPPGTVHLKFPRIFSIAKRLGIDSAPAMVGFEFKNGRSFPIFHGIVVCSEFKSSIMEAYREEEERREAEERKQNEVKAISRWYQLLSSVLTRQRLDNSYANDDSLQTSNHVPKRSNTSHSHHNVEIGAADIDKEPKPKRPKNSTSSMPEKDHHHVFLKEDEIFDEERCVTTKWCQCGFSIQVEEM